LSGRPISLDLFIRGLSDLEARGVPREVQVLDSAPSAARSFLWPPPFPTQVSGGSDAFFFRVQIWQDRFAAFAI